jgi:hypothetical protein
MTRPRKRSQAPQPDLRARSEYGEKLRDLGLSDLREVRGGAAGSRDPSVSTKSTAAAPQQALQVGELPLS